MDGWVSEQVRGVDGGLVVRDKVMFCDKFSPDQQNMSDISSFHTYHAYILISNVLSDPLLLLTIINLALIPLLSSIHFHVVEPVLIAPLTRISVHIRTLQKEQSEHTGNVAKQQSLKQQIAQLQKNKERLIRSTANSNSLFAMAYKINRVLVFLLNYSAWLVALYLQFVDKRTSTAFSLGAEWAVLQGWSIKPLYFLSFLRMLRTSMNQ
mmetsp:Transcript_3237/g.12353  ORF Transcript_3237/g.12353 Transcript_3237/m.12353 type:complete len:209 (-) Transcript_3237:697-1323(-)